MKRFRGTLLILFALRLSSDFFRSLPFSADSPAFHLLESENSGAQDARIPSPVTPYEFQLIRKGTIRELLGAYGHFSQNFGHGESRLGTEG